MTADEQLDFAQWTDRLMSRVVAVALAFGGGVWLLAGAKVSTFPVYALLCLTFIAFFVWMPLGAWLVDKFLTLAGEHERPPSRWWMRQLATWIFIVGMAAWSSGLTYAGIALKEVLVK